MRTLKGLVREHIIRFDSSCADLYNGMAHEQSIPSSVALSRSNLSRNDLILHYANVGYNTREIQSFLSDVHGLTVR